MTDVTEPVESIADRGALGYWRRHRGLAPPVVVLLLVLFLESWIWPYGMRITGTVAAGSVTLRIDRNLDLSTDIELRPGRAIVTGAGWIEAPGISDKPLATHAAVLEANTLRLTALHLGPATELTLDRKRDGTLLVGAKGANGSIELEATGKLTLIPDGKAPLTTPLDDPAVFTIGIDGTFKVPMALQAASKDQLEFLDFPISLLRFGRAGVTGVGETVFVSTIVSGTIKLVDLGRTEELERGAGLGIEGFQGAIVRLESAGADFHLSFTGTAKRLRLGPPGFADDLTPSVLVFLYHQDWLTLLWSAALVGLGILGQVRSWLFGEVD